MNRNPKQIDFADAVDVLSSPEVWQSESGIADACRDIADQMVGALQQPADFPPLEAAIVQGDRVALAVDPNIPGIVEIVEGAIAAVRQTDAEEIEIVLGDEAQEETIAAIAERAGDAIRVVRHRSTDRESVRYLGANAQADPIYLNRKLVDANFVLPIVAGRPLDTSCPHDMTGVFPAFADSAAKCRYRRQLAMRSESSQSSTDPEEVAWLLGVQLMVCVTATPGGDVGRIIAGTPGTVAEKLEAMRRGPEDLPQPAEMVVASLDGSAQQQTWCNAARAVAAASRYVQPEGTIVLWSAIDQPPEGRLLSVDDERNLSFDEEDLLAEENFPEWDESTGTANTLARIASQYRLLIHSRLPDETIESMGFGSIASDGQLARLSQSFDSCAVLRAAQYAGTTFDAPHHVV
jgi:hypothetical protein